MQFNPFSAPQSTIEEHFVIRDKLNSSIWYHKTEALQLLKELVLAAENSESDEDLAQTLSLAIKQFKGETMPKVVEEFLSVSEVLVSRLAVLIVNEDLLAELVYIFLRQLSSPKEAAKLQANSLLNLCQQEIGSPTLFVTILEILSFEKIMDEVMVIASALEVLNVLILSCAKFERNRVQIAVESLLNILLIHQHSKIVQMPVFGAILALRDKDARLTLETIQEAD